jgi:hypothetical protein
MMILPSLENYWSRESTPRHLQAHAGELEGGEKLHALLHMVIQLDIIMRL